MTRPFPPLVVALLFAAACSAPVEVEPAAAAAKSAPGGSPAPDKATQNSWRPTFQDPGPGPRAPTTTAFGVLVGAEKFPEIEAKVKALGLACDQTSIRAQMDARREKEKARIADAKARGEDAVTSASWVNKRSKAEANPQIRFSCSTVASTQLTDRARPPSSGRLLFVFDDVELPLRHVSYHRSNADQTAAVRDFQDTVAALTAIYGAPTTAPTGRLPAPGKDGRVELPPVFQDTSEWRYPDFVARVEITRFGNVVMVDERAEVPSGVRPDAPLVAADQAAATSPGRGESGVKGSS